MTWRRAVGAAVALAVVCSTAFASDARYVLNITNVMKMPEAQERLDPNIKLYFGKQRAPAGAHLGVVVVQPKTPSGSRNDVEACRAVMLRALMELQERARLLDASAVVGIESADRDAPFSSETEFECRAGGRDTRVSLRGRLVR